jgi:hypothetical protein
VFEVEAMVRYNRTDRIFNLPGNLQLDCIRELILVTHYEVSRFESCVAYNVFSYMSQLRKLSVAMKTIVMDGGPDFHSCLETLNLIIWVPFHVQVTFIEPSELLHHDHPTWIDSEVLAAYFNMFTEVRGAGLGAWTATTAIAYDKALEAAKCLKVV